MIHKVFSRSQTSTGACSEVFKGLNNRTQDGKTTATSFPRSRPPNKHTRDPHVVELSGPRARSGQGGPAHERPGAHPHMTRHRSIAFRLQTTDEATATATTHPSRASHQPMQCVMLRLVVRCCCCCRCWVGFLPRPINSTLNKLTGDG
jgi:hypothetical protein